MILRCKITCFSLYIYARVLCFSACFRNKKMQHAVYQRVARFVSYFETFRTLYFSSVPMTLYSTPSLMMISCPSRMIF